MRRRCEPRTLRLPWRGENGRLGLGTAVRPPNGPVRRYRRNKTPTTAPFDDYGDLHK